MKPWIELGAATIPDGRPLRLVRRDDEYAVRIGGTELMSTRERYSEEKLATLALTGTERRVLVGGLGLGFTLRAVLGVVRPDAEILVAEWIPELVAWHRANLVPGGARAIADPRVKVRAEDVAETIARRADAFDAILLDVDNGPVALTTRRNRSLYDREGLAAITRALRPGGTLAVWSVDEVPAFTARLQKAGFVAEAHAVRARESGGGWRTIFVGKKTTSRSPNKARDRNDRPGPADRRARGASSNTRRPATKPRAPSRRPPT